MVDICGMGQKLWWVVGHVYPLNDDLTLRPGDVVSVTVLGRSLIILNSAEIAVDMLDKKSAKYSDRPVLPMGGELGMSS
jgi:hypothetical protein